MSSPSVTPFTAPFSAPFSAAGRPELTSGRRVGVLVVHGFTGAPDSVLAWATDLADRGYAVEAPLLPGHGTTWQDLNRTTWEDWYAEVTRAHAVLAAENDVVVAAGLSMGGALVLQLAADQGDRLAGVAVVNPAVSTRRKDVLALPLIKHVLGSFPGIRSDVAKEGVEEIGYDRTPLRAAHSMMRHWKVLRQDLVRVTAPILFFKSDVDHVVDSSSIEVIRRQVSGEFTLVPLHRSFHVATLDHDAPEILSRTASFVAEVAGLTNADDGAPSRRAAGDDVAGDGQPSSTQ